MKKILCVILSLIIGAMFFVACDNEREEEEFVLPPGWTDPLDLSRAPEVWELPDRDGLLGATTQTTLTVWAATRDIAVIQQLVTQFSNEQNLTQQGIIINVTPMEEVDAVTRFRDSPAHAADVISLPHDQLGAVRPLLFSVVEDVLIDLIYRNTPEAIMASRGIHAGEFLYYGFPYTFDTHVLLYNRALISSEQVQSIEDIFALNMPVPHRPFGMAMGDAFYTINWFLTYGARLFGEYGVNPTFADFNSTESLEAMRFIHENRMSITDMSRSAAVTTMGQGHLATFITGPYGIYAFRQVLGDNLGIARLPTINGEPMVSIANYKMYVVNNRSGNRPLAMQLAAFLSSPENQLRRFNEWNFMPSDRWLHDNQVVLENDMVQAVISQSKNIFPAPSIPQIQRFWDPARLITSGVHAGTMATNADGSFNEQQMQNHLDDLVERILGR